VSHNEGKEEEGTFSSKERSAVYTKGGNRRGQGRGKKIHCCTHSEEESRWVTQKERIWEVELAKMELGAVFEPGDRGEALIQTFGDEGKG